MEKVNDDVVGTGILCFMTNTNDAIGSFANPGPSAPMTKVQLAEKINSELVRNLQLLDSGDISRIFKIRRDAVYDLERSGALPPSFYIGRLRRWDPKCVANWIENKQTDTPAMTRGAKQKHI